MKTRIERVETVHGTVWYCPQYRKWGVWRCFTQMIGMPIKVELDTEDEAKKFIDHALKQQQFAKGCGFIRTHREYPEPPPDYMAGY